MKKMKNSKRKKRLFSKVGPRGSTTQSSRYTATYHPSWKLSKLYEPDLRETAGEEETNS